MGKRKHHLVSPLNAKRVEEEGRTGKRGEEKSPTDLDNTTSAKPPARRAFRTKKDANSTLDDAAERGEKWTGNKLRKDGGSSGRFAPSISKSWVSQLLEGQSRIVQRNQTSLFHNELRRRKGRTRVFEGKKKNKKRERKKRGRGGRQKGGEATNGLVHGHGLEKGNESRPIETLIRLIERRLDEEEARAREKEKGERESREITSSNGLQKAVLSHERAKSEGPCGGTDGCAPPR